MEPSIIKEASQLIIHFKEQGETRPFTDTLYYRPQILRLWLIQGNTSNRQYADLLLIHMVEIQAGRLPFIVRETIYQNSPTITLEIEGIL